MENLTIFFNRVKELSFWQRLFSWKSIKALSYDAFQEFKSLENQITDAKISIDSVERQNHDFQNTIDRLTDQIREFEKAILDKTTDLKIQSDRINQLTEQNHQLNLKINQFENSIIEKEKEYKKNITEISQLKNNLDSDRRQITDDRVREKEEEYERMKKIWRDHETTVQQRIKMICQTHLINYVDKVPFKGNPDNTIEICDEFIIFDAKSPANDDLSKFPNTSKPKQKV